MPTLILDPHIEKHIRAQRAEWGIDRYDEVWEGTYLITPPRETEHSEIQANFVWALNDALISTEAIVYPGVSVRDQTEDWTQNHRCPDVAVVLPGSIARKRGAYYLGGPDFVVEIISSHDRSRDKISFYGQVGVRELLLVDRAPWGIELYRLRNGSLELVGQSRLENPDVLPSAVLPLTFRLIEGQPRPKIKARHADGVLKWLA
jgi:Uma2 family endonuclease